MASRRRELAAVALLLALTGGAADARADEYLEDRWPRGGFMISFGVGPALFTGRNDYSDLFVAGGTGTLRVGAMANRRLTWLLQSEWMGFRAEDAISTDVATQILTINTLGGMVFLRERAWVRGGVGLTSISEDDRQGRTLDNGLGLSGAVGFDAYRRGLWALTLEAASATAVMGNGSITLFTIRGLVTYY